MARTMVLSDQDYMVAACCDVLVEQLTLQDVATANEVSNSAEEFFWAIQAVVRLKEIRDDNQRRY